MRWVWLLHQNRMCATDLHSTIDLMHWCHVSITTTPCWGSRLVALRARHVLCWKSVGALSLSVSARARAARRYGMQELARWLHAWRWRTWQCLVWPPTRGGALLWCHMHKVYTFLAVCNSSVQVECAYALWMSQSGMSNLERWNAILPYLTKGSNSWKWHFS